MPRVDHVRPCAASALETEGPIHSTAHRPTELPASSASWKKINKPPASDLSTCSEAEPIWRVEMWRGGLGSAYLFPVLSPSGASLAAPCSVSTSRSSNLDVRISRIRLTEEASRPRPRKAGSPPGEPDQAQSLVDIAIRKTVDRRPVNLVFSAQPLTQPPASVSFDRPIGFTDWAEAEVVGPSVHHPVERFYYLLRFQWELIPSGLCTDRRADALYALLRRYRTEIAPARLRRKASTERVSQKIEFLVRQLRDPRLALVHPQLQLRHHDPHRGEGLFRPAPATDHKIVGIVDDARSKALLVPQHLPSQHEPAHVKIAEQRADRRTLRGASTLIPIARTPVFPPAFIRLLDWRRQPHLDQMKHGAVGDPACYRL